MLSKTNKVLRNNDIQVKGKVSLKLSCSEEFLNTPDRLFQQKEEIERKILEAKEHYEKIIKETEYNTLLNIKSETKKYIKYNKEQVLQISISIAEQVLREKFKDVSLMSTMIENIIDEYDLKKDLVIKVNSVYKEELENSIADKIEKSNLSQKIFVIADSSIEQGCAEIESGSGKLIVGINSVLDKVREELL